ncbi:hypothetical protein [Moorena sp. SIO4A5]|uniref:hypothetical protein n=1 Tax=Moorena sp. SIO4A5 TaxID=2607838 RepID=UPI0013CC9D4E|nr:hypothetical protein [Moorena sp. SIO4A5]NEO20359.1 hypothetical protein [Moorena sp. SIO4A5]
MKIKGFGWCLPYNQSVEAADVDYFEGTLQYAKHYCLLSLPCSLFPVPCSLKFVPHLIERLSEKSHLLHPSPLNPPILGDFYQQIDSCSPQNWGARGAKFSIKKLFRYPLKTAIV